MATVSATPPPVARRAHGRHTGRIIRYVVLLIAAIYFAGPILAAFWFSIHNDRTGIDFHAYTQFFSAAGFTTAFTMSLLLAVATVVITLLLMVPTMLLAHLRYPRVKQVLEIVSLLPLVVPPVALVVGVRDLITAASSDSVANTPIPSVSNWLQGDTPWLLSLVYVVLALPFTYRAIDAGLTGSAVVTLVEAARNLGANWFQVIRFVVLPVLRTCVLNAALLAFALVLGEFTVAKILNFTTFPVWLSQYGDTDGQLQVGLSLLSLLVIWVLLLLIASAAGRAPRTGRTHTPELPKANS